MLESGLIDYSYTHHWAEQVVMGVDPVPPWLGDLARKKYQGDQSKALREYIYSEPFAATPVDMDKFHVACLWLRYERRELSWATFLRLAGEYLDAVSGDWHCETPYHYLNLFEDAYFSEESEEETKERYLSDQDLRPWIRLAKSKFEPFSRLRRANQARGGGS